MDAILDIRKRNTEEGMKNGHKTKTNKITMDGLISSDSGGYLEVKLTVKADPYDIEQLGWIPGGRVKIALSAGDQPSLDAFEEPEKTLKECIEKYLKPAPQVSFEFKLADPADSTDSENREKDPADEEDPDALEEDDGEEWEERIVKKIKEMDKGDGVDPDLIVLALTKTDTDPNDINECIDTMVQDGDLDMNPLTDKISVPKPPLSWMEANGINPNVANRCKEFFINNELEIGGKKPKLGTMDHCCRKCGYYSDDICHRLADQPEEAPAVEIAEAHEYPEDKPTDPRDSITDEKALALAQEMLSKDTETHLKFAIIATTVHQVHAGKGFPVRVIDTYRHILKPDEDWEGWLSDQVVEGGMEMEEQLGRPTYRILKPYKFPMQVGYDEPKKKRGKKS